MNNTILKYSIITLSIFTFTFSQQERLMWEDLVDKRELNMQQGQKNHILVGSLIITRIKAAS